MVFGGFVVLCGFKMRFVGFAWFKVVFKWFLLISSALDCVLRDS